MTLGNFRVDHHHRHKTTLGSQPGRSRSLGRVSASNDALRTNDIVEYIIFPSPWFLRRPPIHKSIAWCLWSTGLSRGEGGCGGGGFPVIIPGHLRLISCLNGTSADWMNEWRRRDGSYKFNIVFRITYWFVDGCERNAGHREHFCWVKNLMIEMITFLMSPCTLFPRYPRILYENTLQPDIDWSTKASFAFVAI